MVKFCIRLLGLLLFCYLPLSLAQPGDGTASADFIIEDIRVEGLQRISAGSVFAILPVSVGERLSAALVRDSIRRLFESGNFEDVRIGREDNVLVITVAERPSISEINIEGNKAIETDSLLTGLKSSGLAQGQVFKRSTLEGIRLELQRQYVAQGRYDAEIEAEVVEQPRNRVDVNININEGTVAKIEHINIVGNSAFSTVELLDMFELGATNFWSFFTGNNKYSKEKLKGDLETLESHYLDRGYIKFNIESTQVSISPSRDAVYITINVSEGDVYTVNKVELSGDIIIPEEDMQALLLVKEGQHFSRRLITVTEEVMTQRLGNEGYTFAKVSGIPEITEEGRQVAVKFYVDPGNRTYVNRINFRGNTKTIDEVLRREMRQMEGAPAAAHKIEQSRVRLERLGFFKDVHVEMPEVPGREDLIDVNYAVEEQFSGSIGASIGYASGSGLLLGANLQQSNFLGSGKQIGIGVNTSKFQTLYRFSYLNPYYTEDGVSRGFSAYYRKNNYDELRVARYSTDTFGVNMSFGYPLSEIERLGFSLGYSHTEVTAGNYAVQEIKGSPRLFDGIDYLGQEFQSLGLGAVDPDTGLQLYVYPGDPLPFDPLDYGVLTRSPQGFLDEHGDTFDNFTITGTWTQSQLNRGRLADRGSSQSVSLELAVPGSDLEYYKLIYEGQIFVPLTQKLTLRFHTELGFGDGFGSTSRLPFFEHFYAGGFGSVRGYERNTLGPRSTNPRNYVFSQPLIAYDDGTTVDEKVGIVDVNSSDLVYVLDADGKIMVNTLTYDEDPFGGNISVVGGVELLIPLPFIKDQRSLRTVFFVDAGQIYDTDCSAAQEALGCSNVDFGELRYSAGFGLTWITAMGPLTFSLAKPFQYGPYDERKVFDFSLGFGY